MGHSFLDQFSALITNLGADRLVEGAFPRYGGSKVKNPKVLLFKALLYS